MMSPPNRHLSQAPAGDDDLGAPPRQLQRSLVADADAAPGHEGHLPLQSLVAPEVLVRQLLHRPNDQWYEEQTILGTVNDLD